MTVSRSENLRTWGGIAGGTALLACASMGVISAIDSENKITTEFAVYCEDGPGGQASAVEVLDASHASLLKNEVQVGCYAGNVAVDVAGVELIEDAPDDSPYTAVVAVHSKDSSLVQEASEFQPKFVEGSEGARIAVITLSNVSDLTGVAVRPNDS